MTENRRLKSKPRANLLGNAAMIIGFRDCPDDKYFG